MTIVWIVLGIVAVAILGGVFVFFFVEFEEYDEELGEYSLQQTDTYQRFLELFEEKLGSNTSKCSEHVPELKNGLQ